MDAKTEPYDPAAQGWETYPGEGFVGLVGPFWMKKQGESYRYGFVAEKKHHNRRGVVQDCNPTACGLLGETAERLRGRPLDELSWTCLRDRQPTKRTSLSSRLRFTPSTSPMLPITLRP